MVQQNVPGKKVLAHCIVLALLLLLVIGAEAAPYVSYTYDFWGRTVPAPQAYLPERVIDGAILGIGAFSNPRDIKVAADHVYVADTDNNRIVVLDAQWNPVRIIDTFDHHGETDGFSSPFGLALSPAGELYVADRNNSRIVVLTWEGEFLRTLEAPEPDEDGIIPEGFRYRPRKVGVDRAGRVYVIAEDVYDGILEFDSDGTFRGFIGAPRVVLNIAQYVWRLLATPEQRARMQLFLPTEYSNLDVDDRGFIYTTVATGGARDEDAIRRLNPSGADVLRRRGFHPPVGDYGAYLVDDEGELAFPRSTFVDIVQRDFGTYSVFDRTRGRIFTYDAEGRLLYVFGGLGSQRGTFQTPASLTVMGDRIFALDSGRGEITVFEPTEYARSIHEAIASHYSGDYDRANELWIEILGMNSNFDLAYTGMGHAYLRMDEFWDAMVVFRAGQDRPGYSEAFELYRRQQIIENFPWLMYGIFLISAVNVVNRRWQMTPKVGAWRRRQLRMAAQRELVSWRHKLFLQFLHLLEQLSYALYVIRHPFDGFWDLKHERRGSALAACILLFMVTLTYVAMRQYTGFVFNPRRLSDLNTVVEIGSVVLPFLLWSMVSWSLTTLMEGKGTFGDIFVTTAYALVPIILINIPLTVVSNFLTAPEGAFYYLGLTVSTLWTVALLVTATMVIHEYSMPKTLATMALTFVGIIVVLFIALLLWGVFGQVINWIRDLYLEIVFRI